MIIKKKFPFILRANYKAIESIIIGHPLGSRGLHRVTSFYSQNSHFYTIEPCNPDLSMVVIDWMIQCDTTYDCENSKVNKVAQTAVTNILSNLE